MVTVANPISANRHLFSDFGLAFLAAKEKCNSVTRHTSLDASILEIEQKSLKTFLNALCEGPDG